MNKPLDMEERLWEYIDGACDEEERLFIEQLVATNAAWKAKYQELLELQDLLSHRLELDEPSLRFTMNVMETIRKHHIAPAARTYINKRVIWGITGFFILSIIGLFITGFAQVNWSAENTNNSLIDFSKFDLSKYFNNAWFTIFMMINVVLGLMLLDMYLRAKKAKLQERRTAQGNK